MKLLAAFYMTSDVAWHRVALLHRFKRFGDRIKKLYEYIWMGDVSE